MVDDHRKDIEAYTEQANDGSNTGVAAFAAKTLLFLITFFTNVFYYAEPSFIARAPSAEKWGGFFVLVPILGGLIIGLIAAAQRDYLNGKVEDCNTVATIAVTIVAGPLNYLGMNPKISCQTPQPSK